MFYLIIILCILIFFKKIFLLLSFYPIRFWMKREKNKEIRNFLKNDLLNNESVLEYNSFINEIKKLINRYIVGFIRYSIFQVGMIPSHNIRNILYRKVYLVDIEKKAIIYFGSEIRTPYKLKIGEGSIIGDRSILDARNGIYIGKNVNLSSNVSIWTEQHDYKDPYFKCNSNGEFAVKIEDRVWIGPNVIILHSVTIGEGAVVAAGAVVTKSVLPYTLVGGIPAKKLGDRTKDLRYEFNGKYNPFY